jgi:outer membrane protein assembly factor BamB
MNLCRIAFLSIIAIALVSILGCAAGIKSVKDFHYQSDGWDMFRNDVSGAMQADVSLRDVDKLLWSTKMKAKMYASPIVNDGLGVMPALDKRVYFFDPHTGESRGKIKTESSSSSSPALAENLLYIASEEGDGRLRCINVTRGKQVWAMDLGDVSAPIIIHDRTLFVGNYGGEFFSINRFTGELNWKHKTGGPIRGGAAVSGDDVFIGSTDGYLYCLSSDSGDVVWRFDVGSAIFTSPAVGNLCYITTFGGYLVAVDPTSGAKTWEFKTHGSIFSSPVVDDNSVFFGSNDGSLYCVSTADGSMIWRFQTESIVVSTPLVSSDAVIFGGCDARVYFLDKAIGKEFFSYDTSSRIESSPVCYDGMVYVASTDRHIYCFGQSGTDTAISARTEP